VAREQIRQLNQSLAAHPNQDGYAARTGRDLAAVPNAFLWIGGIALFLVIVGFRPLAARLGPAGAVRASVGILVALPLSWLPFALLHVVTRWPDGWVALVLWLTLFGVLLALWPRDAGHSSWCALRGDNGPVRCYGRQLLLTVPVIICRISNRL
jgi:hypothetical protein